ncbi:MAG: translation initiation factor [Opitutales bacterium]
MKKERIPMDGADEMSNNPFVELDPDELKLVQKTPSPPPADVPPVTAKLPNLGRVEVRRETSGRAGKAVTTIRAFRAGTSQRERGDLLRELKKKLAVGGSMRPDGGLEIQGDQRDRVTVILEGKGYRPVQAGG